MPRHEMPSVDRHHGSLDQRRRDDLGLDQVFHELRIGIPRAPPGARHATDADDEKKAGQQAHGARDDGAKGFWYVGLSPRSLTKLKT